MMAPKVARHPAKPPPAPRAPSPPPRAPSPPPRAPSPPFRHPLHVYKLYEDEPVEPGELEERRREEEERLEASAKRQREEREEFLAGIQARRQPPPPPKKGPEGLDLFDIELGGKMYWMDIEVTANDFHSLWEYKEGGKKGKFAGYYHEFREELTRPDGVMLDFAPAPGAPAPPPAPPPAPRPASTPSFPLFFLAGLTGPKRFNAFAKKYLEEERGKGRELSYQEALGEIKRDNLYKRE